MIIGGYVNMSIPPPSVLSNYLDNDDDFIGDPDKVRDALPQPYRLINKIIDFTFDIAWDEIDKQEKQRAADSLRIKPDKFECQLKSNVDGARTMVESRDGNFLFIGTTSGVTVVNALTGELVDEHSEDDMIIAEIACSLLDEGQYIITTMDVIGIARLFLFNGDCIHLAKILNENDSGLLANKVEVSNDMDYIAISLVNQNTGEAWIEFHRVPKDVWIKEAGSIKDKSGPPAPKAAEDPVFQTETRESENPTPEVQHEHEPSDPPPHDPAPTHESKSQSNFRFSNTTMILKVKAPTPLKPSVAVTAFQAFKTIDSNSDVIANGQNHILSAGHIEGRDTVFRAKHKELMQYNTDEEVDAPIPCINFISPTRFNPMGLDTNKPTSAAIWWQNGNQLSVYSLVKQAKDVNYRPDQIWPMPHRIRTSDVSPCGQLLALGLANGSVLVWDLFSGLQRRVHCLTPGRAITQVKFMDPSVSHQAQPFQSHLPYQTLTSCYVLALSEDGQLYPCDTTMGIELTRASKVVHEELDSRLTKFQLLPGIPFMILGTFDDGKIYLIHALNGNFICEIVVPEPYQMEEDCIGTVGGRGQTIFCKAIEPPEESKENEEIDPTEPLEPEMETAPEEVVPKTTLFLLECLKFDILNTAWSKNLPKVPFVLHTTLDKRLDALMQERVASQTIRQARLQTTWQSMGFTLEELLKSKKEKEDRPKTADSFFAASTIVGSDVGPDWTGMGF